MTHPRKISAILAATAALGAGAAGATTIVSGSNSVFVHQSPGGTVIRHAEPVARTTVLRQDAPLRFTETRVHIGTHEPDVTPYPRLSFFMYLLPWNWGASPVAREPRVEVRPRIIPDHTPDHGVNRAEAMMDRVMSRMNR
ncbi:hypothetical protein JI664_17575 [Rhodobacter sp. NTK016B]|uniref:hypothetical protein n=1 Tax=Rhodobacter sp. NTK016B TaxID=2759676 RepID=UPI001A8E851A|nr:hypothetical protein [Rhodobacter sp. NTK016B]MBN8293786.1 hypothetical protein [Rhodobacter sp. NTK016B]